MLSCQLRESNRFGWIHAIVCYTTGVRQLREASRIGWFHATAVYPTGVWLLRKTGRISWFYATAACEVCVDKAIFHATQPNRGSCRQTIVQRNDKENKVNTI